MTNLALDLARCLDPTLLLIVAGIEADAWQREFLNATAPQLLMLCSRQSGKSTVLGALGLHTALYAPHSLVLMIAPGQRQSGELFRKLLTLYRALRQPMDPEQESQQRLELANRSRIVSLPGTAETLRGYSAPKLVLIDEAQHVSDDTYHALRPMLATGGGRLIAAGTAGARLGWFYDEFEHGGPDWHRWRITADRCGRISPAFLDRERRSLPDRVFRAEYFCQWFDAEDQVFGADLIARAFTPEVQPLLPGLSPW